MKLTFEAYTGKEPFAFLSYAHADKATIFPDAEWLQDSGVRIWYDDGIRGGKRWAPTIGSKIRSCSVVLLFMSSGALRERSEGQSESYVYTEIALAKKYRKPLIVVMLEPLELPARLASVNAWQQLPRYEWEKMRYLTRLRDDALTAQRAGRPHSRLKSLFDAEVRRLNTLEKLVQTVDQALIGGFLVPTLEEGIEIEPPMVATWANGRSRPLPAELARKAFFKDSGVGSAPRLLISGASGSGKSIQLLKFVDALLPRGGSLSLTSSIPVVLNASSWVNDPIRMRTRDKGIRGWVEEQMLSRYGIPRATSRYLIENFQLIYCLDGLDEIGRSSEPEAEGGRSAIEAQESQCRELRQQFLGELERFLTREEGSSAGCIVCSRPSPAEELVAKMPHEFCRIRIEDLTGPAALEAIRKNHLDILERFADTPGVRDLLKSPLGLQMLAVAYPSGAAAEAGYDFLDRQSVKSVQEKVYRRFFTQKVSDFKRAEGGDGRPKQLHPHLNYRIQKSTSSIAKYLVNRSRDLVFRLDELQPYELPPEDYLQYRRRAAWMVMGAITVCAGIPVGVAVGTDRYFAGERFTAVTYGALTLVGVGGPAAAVAAFGYQRFTGSVAGVFVGLAFAIGRGLTVGFSARVAGSNSGLEAGLRHGLATLTMIPVFALLLHLVKEDPLNIAPIETWETNRSVALVSVLVAAAVFGWVFHRLLGPARGISFGLCLAVAMGRRFARRPRKAPLKISANQAIDYTRNVAISNTLGITIASMAIFGGVYGKYFDKREGVNNAVLAMTFLVSFFFFGGLSVLKHFALRRTLRKLRLMPRHDLQFLETASRVGLMRKVGGSFVFPHESITKYFAGQDPSSTWGLAKVTAKV